MKLSFCKGLNKATSFLIYYMYNFKRGCFSFRDMICLILLKVENVYYNNKE